MSQENVETVRAALQAPFPVFLSAFHDDAEFHAPRWGLDRGVYRGRADLADWLRRWMGTWEGWEIEPQEYIDGACRGGAIQRGRSKETGLVLDHRHWSVITLRDGKIVSWRNYRTRIEALEAAGLSE
jgi:ketosteroid isomerase-like protein